MGYWSAANATEAYIKTMKMGKRANEPDGAEFISAIAAGNNAQFMVVVCAATAGSTTLGLIAASHQTGGKIRFDLNQNDYFYSMTVLTQTHIDLLLCAV